MLMSKKFDFVIRTWSAWAPGFNNQGHRQNQQDMQTEKAGLPAHVPKALQRRLSPLARAVFNATDLCIGNVATPIVLSSAHGEVNKSLEMLKAMQRGEEISPTAFSLSVHNAISGLFSIAHNNHQEITVLAPGQDGISMVFLEALGILHERRNNTDDVLIVLYDEPLSDFYPSLSIGLKAPTSCALAIKIALSGQGLPLQLQRSPEHRHDSGEHALQIFAFLEFLTSENTTLQLGNHRQSWIWHKQ
ncbi:MAG: hypothetical protein HOO92_07845 [Methylococcaceae bacterium]|nr:hypothetical protein [Methylococcaceae bacterium]